MAHPEFDDPDLPLSDLFARWPGMMVVFFDHRMLCPGCPIAPFHAISEACFEYGLNEEAFREELRQAVAPEGGVSPGRR